MNGDERSNGTAVAVLVGAVAILVSGWVHFYLYFRGGYRGIAPESVLGLTISRSFALNAVVALILAEALVLSLRYRALLLPAAAARRRLRGRDARRLLPVAHPRAARLRGELHHNRGSDRDDRGGHRDRDARSGRGQRGASSATSSALTT